MDDGSSSKHFKAEIINKPLKRTVHIMEQSDLTERIESDALNQAIETSKDRNTKLPPTNSKCTSQDMHDVMRAGLVGFQFQRHSLRISASNVAAMAGYHPYKNLPELLVQLVYQGHLGRALLQNDSQLLGLTLITPQEALNELAKKAGVDKTLKEALKTVKKGEVTTVEKAQALKLALASKEVKKHLSPTEWEQFREGIRSAVDTNYGVVHENAALDEYQKLCGWPISDRNTAIRSWAFVRSEDASDEQKIGAGKTAVPIKEAESLLVYPFPREHDDSERSSNKKQKIVVDLTIVTEKLNAERKVDPCPPIPLQILDDTNPNSNSGACLSSEDTQAGKDTHDAIEIDINVMAQEELVLSNNTLENSAKATRNTQPMTIESVKDHVLPYFYILGSVDGIRDELAPTQENKVPVDFDDDNSWNIRSIIVECKHRMSRLHSPPPLYEQIQASIYCLMYGVNDADIVQVLRQDSKAKPDTSSRCGQRNEAVQTAIKSFAKMNGEEDISIKSEGAMESDQDNGKPRILVSRVSLDDPTLQHKTNWTTIVLPRLRAFVDAVYSIRSSDGLRYRLLASTSESELGSFAAWEFLHEQCPWLAECDTAFSRLNKNKT